jgi:hypothetical protein
MKYLKKFNEEVEEKSIEDWCEKFNIIDYEIVNGLVNVNGHVYLDRMGLEKFPIKFGIINYGNFTCVRNRLLSLEGGPVEVGGDFDCEHNDLTTLEGGPVEVGEDFDCANNYLISLKGAPKQIEGNFDCEYNDLISLDGCPSEIGIHFNCGQNKLTSLKGGPYKVGDYFDCQDNKLISLEGCPEKINSSFDCMANPIYEVYRLFKTFDRYQASLDYKYLRGTNIVRGRFIKACEDAKIKVPKSIDGYEYIDL